MGSLVPYLIVAESLSPKRIPKIMPYVELSRPQNIPASMIFSAGGTLSVVDEVYRNDVFSTPTGGGECLTSMVVVAGIAVFSTVINGYFDALRGVDDGSKNPIVRGEISYSEVRGYAGKLALMLAVLVGTELNAPPELKWVYGGGIAVTYVYTEYLKPVFLLKNVSVALLTALAPISGGISKLGSLAEALQSEHLVGLATASFFGIFHREVLMDILDMEGDKNAGVETFPVLYGVEKSLLFTAGLLSVVLGSGMMFSKTHWLSDAGTIAMMYNVMGLYKKSKGGADVREDCKKAIESSILTFVLVVLSYCF